MTVRELNPDQYKKLCQVYITVIYDMEGKCPSWGELAAADELVDQQIIFNYYDGIDFTNDDFGCTAGKENDNE